MPTTLAAMPPMALCSAMRRRRRRLQQLVHAAQRRIHHDRAGRIRRDLALVAEGETHRGRHERRRVVDAVADEDRGRLRHFRARQRDLLSGVHCAWISGDADWSADTAPRIRDRPTR
jgi:hypothetical protein